MMLSRSKLLSYGQTRAMAVAGGRGSGWGGDQNITFRVKEFGLKDTI